MTVILAIIKKESVSYLLSPLAAFLIASFIIVSSVLTFYLGMFFEKELADLEAFFSWHPYIYLFFTPAVSMRLWAEERQQDTFEFLVSLPSPVWKIVLGKFIAAWIIIIIALIFSGTMWIGVSLIGEPDHMMVFTGYMASILLAGMYLSFGSYISSLSDSQVIAYIKTVIANGIFMFSGLPVVVDMMNIFLPADIVYWISWASFYTNFMTVIQGVIELKFLVFAISFIIFWLFMTCVSIETKGRVV